MVMYVDGSGWAENIMKRANLLSRVVPLHNNATFCSPSAWTYFFVPHFSFGGVPPALFRAGAQLARSGHTAEHSSPPTVLFLSRADAGMRCRRLLNEAEVVGGVRAWVNRWLPHVQLRVVSDRNTSHERTIELFQTAVLVLGLHGGAFANLLLARASRSTAVLEFKVGGDCAREYHWRRLADGLRHCYFSIDVDCPGQAGAVGAACLSLLEVTKKTACRWTAGTTPAAHTTPRPGCACAGRRCTRTWTP